MSTRFPPSPAQVRPRQEVPSSLGLFPLVAPPPPSLSQKDCAASFFRHAAGTESSTKGPYCFPFGPDLFSPFARKSFWNTLSSLFAFSSFLSLLRSSFLLLLASYPLPLPFLLVRRPPPPFFQERMASSRIFGPRPFPIIRGSFGGRNDPFRRFASRVFPPFRA